MHHALARQVDEFAALMAEIDDPFGDREQVLATAGVGAMDYEPLVASWRARLDGDATGNLTARFANAYAARRAELRQPLPEQRAEAVRDPVLAARAPIPTASPVREAPTPEAPAEASRVAFWPIRRPPAHLAATADVKAFVPAPATPFSAVPMSLVPSELPPTEPSRSPVGSSPLHTGELVPREVSSLAYRPPAGAPSVRRAPKEFEATAEVSALVAQAVTPFEAPPGSPASAPPGTASAAPRQRLIRFDPQTGQPLPMPTWVDLPPKPKETK